MFKLEDHISEEQIKLFCKKNHIIKLSLFGSALRDELLPGSDIDLLVEFDSRHMPGLFDMARMELELKEFFGRDVDIRTPEDLSRYFRNDVMTTATVQYEEI